MKFAFSTATCPDWDLPTIASRAKEYGYAGVEFAAADARLAGPDRQALGQILAEAGIALACLDCSAATAEQVRAGVDLAQQLGGSLVKVPATAIRPGAGQSSEATAVALGDWLLPLGDYASERGVVLAIENTLAFRSARAMWLLLDRISHPAVACCWNALNAAAIGEPPSLSVPVLNSRIQYVHVSDAKLSPAGPVACKLGEGDVPVQKLILRLRGIGYRGYVTVGWERAEPEGLLRDALARLKDWSGQNPPPQKPAKAAHVPAKPAAAPAVASAG